MKRMIISVAAALVTLGAVAATQAEEVKLLNVSYDPTRELYSEINRLFAEQYKAKTGTAVTIEQSHGGSSAQARSVIDGLKADIVTLGLGWDIIAIERAGLINSGWQAKLPFNASPYTSTVAFLVRKGNPKKIKGWSDLIRPDVQVIAPNPKTSGGARWVFLAAWGSATGAKTHDFSTASGIKAAEEAGKAAKDFPVLSDAKGEAYVTALYKNVPVLDSGARGSTVTFAQKQIGDVLVNWENELWLAKEEFGKDDFEIVYPSVSVLGEPPVAVVDQVVDKRGTRAVSEAYLRFLYTKEAQDVIAQLHYRPRDTDSLKRYGADLPKIPLFTVDETFGGWIKAQQTFFADGGVFDRIYKPKK